MLPVVGELCRSLAIGIFHSDLRSKIIDELAKDFSRRPLEDIASLIANA